MERYPKQELDASWVHAPITPEIVDWCESFGKFLATSEGEKKALTTNQLRKFFGEVKRIEIQEELCAADIIMLKPLLAYAAGRDKKNTKIKDFQKQITIAISGIRMDKEDITKDFKNFINIFEAIVAYHKFNLKESE